MPKFWLFTDEKLGGESPQDPLWQAVRRLPRGAGILVRHYGWPAKQRAALLTRLEAIGKRRGLVVVASGIAGARGGVHRPAGSRAPARRGLVTAAAHSRREVAQAFANGADLVFLSPAFPTSSHPGQPALGPVRFGLIAQAARGPVLALGGMNRARARRLSALGAVGYGAIDDWVR